MFVEGLANLQELGKLMIGQNVQEILRSDLGPGTEVILDLRVAIEFLESILDYVWRELLERILESEEEYVHSLEKQIELIDKAGLKNTSHWRFLA